MYADRSLSSSIRLLCNGNTTPLAVTAIEAHSTGKSKLTVSLEMDDGSQKLLDVIE
jgi:hypothetical protein